MEKKLKSINFYAITLSAFLTFAGNNLYAQNVQSFCASFGNNHWAESIIETSDGNFLIAGRPGILSNLDYFVAKMDPGGNIIWFKRMGTPLQDYCYAISETASGDYLLAGMTSTNIWSLYLIKIDSSGTVLWSGYYGGSSYKLAVYAMAKTSDGGFAFTGDGNAAGPPYTVYAARIDSSYNLLWEKTIVGGNGDSHGYSIIQTMDGGFAIAGEEGGNTGNQKMYVIKLDGQGNQQWARTINGNGGEDGRSIIQKNNGDYIIAGSSDSFSSGTSQIYLVKLDSSGNFISGKAFMNTPGGEGRYIVKTHDGGYAVTGTVTTAISSVCILRFDGNDSLLWAYNNPTLYGHPHCIIETKDHGFAITGEYDIALTTKVLVMKVDSLGNSCCMTPLSLSVDSGGTIGALASVFPVSSPLTGSGAATINISDVPVIYCTTVSVAETAPPPQEIEVLPNPSGGIFTVTFPAGYITNSAGLEILDMPGKKIYYNKNPSSPIVINIREFGAGIYLLQLVTGSIAISKKIVIE